MNRNPRKMLNTMIAHIMGYGVSFDFVNEFQHEADKEFVDAYNKWYMTLPHERRSAQILDKKQGYHKDD